MENKNYSARAMAEVGITLAIIISYYAYHNIHTTIKLCRSINITYTCYTFIFKT